MSQSATLQRGAEISGGNEEESQDHLRRMRRAITVAVFTGPVFGLVDWFIVIGLALAWVALQVGTWALTEARWSVVTNNLRLFLIGQYPADQAWRIWVNLLIRSVLGGLSAAAFGQATRTLAVTLSAIQLMLAALMLLSPLGLVPAAAMLANACETRNAGPPLSPRRW